MFDRITLLVIILSVESTKVNNDRLDLIRTTPQLIESRNFKSEIHFIRTSDGYILQIFRIINPYLNRKELLKPIVLQYGFTGVSDEFLISRKGYLRKDGHYIEDGTVITNCTHNSTFGKTLGFVLSVCGYDVWLSNIRSSKYANHTVLKKDDFHYWKFTMDEHSLIDLPAIIDYIGVRTKTNRIGYIGYSMGTTIMFALMSAQPTYSAIIDPFIAIAPVVYISKIPQIFLQFKYLYLLLRAIPAPLLPSDSFRKLITRLLGEQSAQDSYTNEMVAHIMDQSSTLVLSHFLQIITNDRFSRFDWGPFENYICYGRANPPVYPLANITSKRIALIKSKYNDIFSDFKDLLRLKNELKVKPLLDYWVPDNNWKHSDYLFNDKTDKYLVSVVMNILNTN